MEASEIDRQEQCEPILIMILHEKLLDIKRQRHEACSMQEAESHGKAGTLGPSTGAVDESKQSLVMSLP